MRQISVREPLRSSEQYFPSQRRIPGVSEESRTLRRLPTGLGGRITSASYCWHDQDEGAIVQQVTGQIGYRGEDMRIRWMMLAGITAIAVGMPAAAQETTTYTYDALGRLVATGHSGGPNNGVQTGITYDQAGNRVTYNTSGSSQSSPTPTPGSTAPPGSAPAPGSRIFIVVPLSGFTLIPIVVPGP